MDMTTEQPARNQILSMTKGSLQNDINTNNTRTKRKEKKFVYLKGFTPIFYWSYNSTLEHPKPILLLCTLEIKPYYLAMEYKIQHYML